MYASCANCSKRATYVCEFESVVKSLCDDCSSGEENKKNINDIVFELSNENGKRLISGCESCGHDAEVITRYEDGLGVVVVEPLCVEHHNEKMENPANKIITKHDISDVRLEI